MLNISNIDHYFIRASFYFLDFLDWVRLVECRAGALVREGQGCPDLGAWDQPVSAQDAMLRCVPRVSPPH